ncbi:SDR family oxidoreductase [Nocardia sp. BSTN01]|uniref:SDR family oxidoreductase n=1 Tax=Nocardia sp. BSTN01 TaxID=2783665 RepID=UPI00188F190B|nr:SDR family oxidoreductase [Nocardia sp. BSTN01]MBF5000398.1 SDR family oxidoreductase [Nocardia sp. BSTN01]
MILITGATGNNGKAVVQQFARHGVPVRALVRDRARAGALLELSGVDVVEGDLLQPQTLGPALEGIDRALMISTADSTLVEAQCTFIDAAVSAGVRHVVKYSGFESGKGFDQEKFRYTRNHQQIERYLETSGLEWTHLRPGQFMQVYLREARSIIERGILALPAGDIRLAPVDIDDIAAVTFRLLTTEGHEGSALHMTGPEALTMGEVAALFSELIGKPVEYVPITPEERREYMLSAGVPVDFVEATYQQARERLNCPEPELRLDTHYRFGVRPTTFAEFLQRHKHIFNQSAIVS